MDTQGTSYDLVPYESFPFADTHPGRLAVLGRLFGLQPPRLADCRVLELGCASGGNLIPMALSMPDAQFVGVDLSAVQIAQGEKVIADLGLTNIRLLALSITAIDESLGQFDYILTHGVYSWVPNAVQEKILAICAGRIRANGIAYVSYNTLPGWRMRGMIRDLMRYHATQFVEPDKRAAQARAIVDFLAKWVPAENNAYGMLLKSELDGLRRAADYYILHEHLEDINEPLYFHEFAERAARHGLQYLAEANFSTMLASNFPPEVNETLIRIAPDVIRQEQFMDFLRNRTFRQTLLVRKEASIVRSLTPERVTSLWVSGALTPANANVDLASRRDEVFQGLKGGMMLTPNPVTKAAMIVLARHWPGRLSFAQLLGLSIDLLGENRDLTAKPEQRAETVLASDLLQCCTAGLVEFHVGPAPFVAHPGERPQASPLARWQAGQGFRQVTSLRHEMVRIEADQGKFLQMLDGTRSRRELREAAKGLSLPDPDGLLTQMGRSALLQA
jgi:methyltransferase-like protein/SAM-dependent methyltransferase